MKGIWYSSNGWGCEHWFLYTERANGAGWEAISRCGMASALPSLLKDKFEWREAHLHAPRIEGRLCNTCLKLKKRDEEEK
jgi:hypothetical protein